LLAAWIVSAAVATCAAPATVKKVRFYQSPDKVRVVLDVTAAPDWNIVQEGEPLRLLIDLPAAVDPAVLPQIVFNDPFVASLQIADTQPERARIVINLNMPVEPKLFKLSSPERLVIDLFKVYDQKTDRDVMPGIRYTAWLRSRPAGVVKAHILRVDPRAGFVLKPVLAGGAVQGLETVAGMSAGARAVAAVNASYFAANGDIIGLLKIDGEIISTPNVPRRTAVGIFPDGRLIFGPAAWQGYVELPGGRVGLTGVNRARGDNELILYTGFYGPSTATNAAGAEYVIGPDGRVAAVGRGNTPIEAGCAVLSAHGVFAQELAGLKVGDRVTVRQTLGPEWDGTLHALGAGPMLVKDGGVYLTTKTEDFGSDVAGGRAPRTALGVTKDGAVLFVVVDGRQAASAGLTLLELALLMQELGAVDAMNFDGGGSSEMVIYDKVVNKPSDGRERKVGSALAVVSAKLAN